MKLHSICILSMFLSSACMAQPSSKLSSGGAMGGGGGFVNYDVDRVLIEAQKEAISYLNDADIETFKGHPERRQKAILGLKKLKIMAGVRHFRDHRELMFDYNLEQNTIMVLKPYWEKFGALNPDNHTLNEMLYESDMQDFTRRYLIREVAHFWNHGDDIDSDRFAAEVEVGDTFSTERALGGIRARVDELAQKNANDADFDSVVHDFYTGKNVPVIIFRDPQQPTSTEKLASKFYDIGYAAFYYDHDWHTRYDYNYAGWRSFSHAEYLAYFAKVLKLFSHEALQK